MVPYWLTVTGDRARAAAIVERLEDLMGISWTSEMGGAKYQHLFTDDRSPAQIRDEVNEALNSVDATWADVLQH
jgi:hypothetical protein